MPLLYIALGGALGALARYGVSLAFLAWLGRASFWGTFAANLGGCFAIGVAWGLAEAGLLGPRAALFALTGFLGAFTTFSTFSLETLVLLRGGEVGAALAYAVGSVVVGLVAVWLGMILTQPGAAVGP